MSVHPLDVRLARLEGSYDQISDRLNGFDLRFASLEQKMDSGFARVDKELAEIRRLLVTGAVTIGGFVLVSILLPLVDHIR